MASSCVPSSSRAAVPCDSVSLGKRRRGVTRWHCEHHDYDGGSREVIVIEDTPPPASASPSLRSQEPPSRPSGYDATVDGTLPPEVPTVSEASYGNHAMAFDAHNPEVLRTPATAVSLLHRTPPPPPPPPAHMLSAIAPSQATCDESAVTNQRRHPLTPQEPWRSTTGVWTRGAKARWQQQQQQQQLREQAETAWEPDKTMTLSRRRVREQPTSAYTHSVMPNGEIVSDKHDDADIPTPKRRRRHQPPAPLHVDVSYLTSHYHGQPATSTSSHHSTICTAYNANQTRADPNQPVTSQVSHAISNTSHAPVTPCQCEACALPMTPLRSDSLYTLAAAAAAASAQHHVAATTAAVTASLPCSSQVSSALVYSQPLLSTMASHGAYAGNAVTTSSNNALTKLTHQQALPSTFGTTVDNSIPVATDANTSVPAPLPPCDDKEGHYIVIPNENLTQRFKIMRLLGQGTFGKVAHCWDRQTRKYCAIKIIRAVQKYRDASRIEIRVLRELQRWDPKNQYRCIHLRECFDYRNHICMVFDLLGQSIFDFMKSNHFTPFPALHIQHLARQLLTSVAFLHRIGLVHTDLKPENILLTNDASYTYTTHNGKQRRLLIDTEIRLIDFGSATFEKEYHSAVVSTRHYRAPEIILGCGWSYPCDIWSIGCILVELFTGEALFQTHDNLEHLAMMEAAIGPIPASMIQRASPAGRAFFRDCRLIYPTPETSRASRKYVAAMRQLDNIIVPDCPFNIYLLDLVQRMLVYDPAKRITAQEALRQPFFQLRLPSPAHTLAANLSSVESGTLAGAIHHRENYGVMPTATHPPAFLSEAGMHGQAYG